MLWHCPTKKFKNAVLMNAHSSKLCKSAGEKKLRRMFDINKTHVVATTVSMMIHDTTGYKCKQCEKPRVPIHLVGTIEVCLIKQSVVENAISVFMRNPVKHLIILFCSHIILLIWYVKLAWHLCLILQWHPLNLLKTKREKKNHSARKKTPTICPQGSISSPLKFFHVLDKDMALCWYKTGFSYCFFF